VQKCDKAFVTAFDYSKSSPAFSKLSKPAKRALINSRIYSPADLAKWTLLEVSRLHGIGPSAVEELKKIAREKRVSFKT
jgi:hypothetical protein